MDEVDTDVATDIESDTEENVRNTNIVSKQSGYRFQRSFTMHTISSSSDDDESVKEPLAKKPKVENDFGPTTSKDNRPLCRYGSQCYRKNPQHLQEFQHPKRKPSKSISEDSNKANSTGSSKTNYPDTTSKLTDNYNIYLTSVTHQKASRHPELSLKDILSARMGKLVASAQFSFMFEVDWMLAQYPEEFRSKPLLLVHGTPSSSTSGINLEVAKYKNISTLRARLDIAYGTHHTKMMLLLYEEGLRVVIHTANMVSGDWALKTQGIWMSPVCPRLMGNESKSESAGDSKTKFKQDLLQYLRVYRHANLDRWIKAVVAHDFSSIKVYLIASIPGRFSGANKNSYGHLKLRSILSHRQLRSKYPADFLQWPIIGQFSSIGSLGPDAGTWLLREWLSSLGAPNPPSRCRPQLIYPCVEDVRKSLEGYPAGGSLPYNSNTAKKQVWLNSYFHKWRASNCSRTEASPHIKSYCRTSPGGHRLSWFLLTSANLSKAAWGALEKNDNQLMIRSYELGVLLLPEDYGEDYFSLSDGPEKFPLPYNMPLTSYEKSGDYSILDVEKKRKDRPWIVNLPYTQLPDRHGNMWVPS